MQKLKDLASKAAARADAIGCGWSTQGGGMPPHADVLSEIIAKAGRRPWPKDAEEAHARFMAVAAEALFGALLTAPSDALSEAHARIAAMPAEKRREAMIRLSRSYSAPGMCIRYDGCRREGNDIVWPDGERWPTRTEE